MSLEDVIFDILSQWEGISTKSRFEVEFLTREIVQAVHEHLLKDAPAFNSDESRVHRGIDR